MPSRSNKDCRKRYLNEMAASLKKVVTDGPIRRPYFLSLSPSDHPATGLVACVATERR